ncbi:MAG: ATP-binding cassette domain-containing protein [Betaproteobacteria bacterium]|nr:ATP-binding cassette domain-containing protein [Betaproteobacteria bacterium]
MTNACLILHRVAFRLPDGRALFKDLDAQFDACPTGLVGRNGIGKSVLAKILAGLIEPSAGSCARPGRVRYLAQQIATTDYRCVADVAGVQGVLDALARIEAGSTAHEDFDRVGDAWDMRQRLHNELAQNGLGHLAAEDPAARLSGGECTRVALLGAFLAEPDFLILDEPTNHLDRPNRLALFEQLARWRGGLIVVSHDRELLERMERIVELSSLGLRSYGGGYSFYAEQKALERENAIADLERAKLERKRGEQTLREQRERQERRQASGRRERREGNQAKIVLNAMRERSEDSGGKLRQQQAATREELSQKVREAAGRIEEATERLLFAPGGELAPGKRVLSLQGLRLPFGSHADYPIELELAGPRRVALRGPNGCGKSTLLRVIAGEIAPAAGRCEVRVRTAYLDQQAARLDPARSLLEQFAVANPQIAEGELRTWLALLGLGVAEVTRPSGKLSGGERLKAALALELYAETPAQLLLLDEPSNHLDLVSLEALEAMLREYRGALLVVSHDERFLARLNLDASLTANDGGWRFDAGVAEKAL